MADFGPSVVIGPSGVFQHSAQHFPFFPPREIKLVKNVAPLGVNQLLIGPEASHGSVSTGVLVALGPY